MALWKDTAPGTATAPAAGAAAAPVPHAPREVERAPVQSISPEPVRRPPPPPAPAAVAHAHREQRVDMRESVIASDLTIEGKIVGTGHVRIAGRFKGDVQVEGNLSIDPGAHLEGLVKAAVVVVGGELIGNIDQAKRVELLEGGVITGDVKAGSLTVAAGSRMRGQVEFGWDGEGRGKAHGA